MTCETHKGNYFNLGNKYLIEVVSISEDSRIECYNHTIERLERLGNHNHIDGILLNDDWKRNLGFENSEGSCWNLKENKAFCLIGNMFYLHDQFIRNVEFVHQIQNLYSAIADKRLTYKLIKHESVRNQITRLRS